MGCILLILGLIFPRVLIVILWLLTNWFSGMFDSILLPVLGLIFMPVTLLWYSVVLNSFGGEWNVLNVAIMVIAVLIDFGAFKGGYNHRRKRRY